MVKFEDIRIETLWGKDLESILSVEQKSFIPQIHASRETILHRLGDKHVYLGAYIKQELIGTLAFRYAQFEESFISFSRKYPSFEEYANSPNEKNSNSIIIYSLGIIPEYRGRRIPQRLINNALRMAKTRRLNYAVGDGRIPSYNGSNNSPKHESFECNPILRKEIDDSIKKNKLPDRRILSMDPITGFYLIAMPQTRILGITSEKFCSEDHPTGGRKVIVYLDLKGEK